MTNQIVTKTCYTCKQTKSIDEFWKNKNRYDGCQIYCKICQRKVNDKWIASHPAVQKEVRLRHKNKDVASYLEKHRKRNARSRNKLINEVFMVLGNACACCGETERSFLCIDHINNDGAEHRKLRGASAKGRNGVDIYVDVRKEGFPRDRYQVLCFNCNMSKYRKGKCFHQTELEKLTGNGLSKK